MAFRLKLTFVFVAGWAAAAFGQRVMTLHPVELSGSVVQTGPAGGRDQGRQRAELGPEFAARQPQSQDHRFRRTRDVDAGTCVRFVARIDKRTCKGQEKLDAITIFTPTPGMGDRTLGVDLAGERPDQRRKRRTARWGRRRSR